MAGLEEWPFSTEFGLRLAAIAKLSNRPLPNYAITQLPDFVSSYLVTGGAGFIGSHLAEELLRLGQRVRVADSLITGRRRNLMALGQDVEFLEGERADEAFPD